MQQVQETPMIVVGVDGSACSVEALRLAGRLAPALGAKIHAVTCWEYPVIYTGYTPLGLGGYEQEAAQALSRSLESAFAGNVPAGLQKTVIEGSAAGVLVDASRNARMLVLGRRGHGGFRGLLLGSVSAACVTHAGCPVLVVHEDDVPAPPERRLSAVPDILAEDR